MEICPGQRPETAYSVLRRIHITTIDENRLRHLVDGEARLALLDPRNLAIDRLHCLVADSVHRRLDRGAILSDLATVGVQPRQRSTASAETIDAVTESYMRSAARRLIHSSLLSTSAISDLVDGIVNAAHSTSILVTGGAGSGKTATLYGAVSALRAIEPHIPILAIRLDRADPTPSADQLGKRLGLRESPALAIGAGAGQGAERAVRAMSKRSRGCCRSRAAHILPA